MRAIDADALNAFLNGMKCVLDRFDDDERPRYEGYRKAVEILTGYIEDGHSQTIEPSCWIPCSERLPNLNEDGVSDMVLLCWSDGQMTVGAYRGDRTFVGQAWPMARDCRVTVIAWMLLPKPYSERRYKCHA